MIHFPWPSSLSRNLRVPLSSEKWESVCALIHNGSLNVALQECGYTSSIRDGTGVTPPLSIPFHLALAPSSLFFLFFTLFFFFLFGIHSCLGHFFTVASGGNFFWGGAQNPSWRFCLQCHHLSSLRGRNTSPWYFRALWKYIAKSETMLLKCNPKPCARF